MGYSARYARQIEKHGHEDVKRRGRLAANKFTAANRDKVNAKRCKKRRTVPAARIKETVEKAAKRGIAYALTYELALALVTSVCAYCGGGDEVNGIDRMDSAKGYVAGNVVPACATCNMAKGTLCPTSFIERCKHIALGETHTTCWSDTYPGSVSYEKSCVRHACEKDLELELTEARFEELVAGACHYCRRPTTHRHKNGIDRLDPKLGYTAANSVACCGQCNISKGTLASEEFLAMARRVASYQHTANFSGVPRCPRVQHRDAYDVPVQQLDVETGEVLATFATIRLAAESLLRDMHEATVMARIKYWAAQGGAAYGYGWLLVP